MNFCIFGRLKCTKLTKFKASKCAKKAISELISPPKLKIMKLPHYVGRTWAGHGSDMGRTWVRHRSDIGLPSRARSWAVVHLIRHRKAKATRCSGRRCWSRATTRSWARRRLDLPGRCSKWLYAKGGWRRPKRAGGQWPRPRRWQWCEYPNEVLPWNTPLEK